MQKLINVNNLNPCKLLSVVIIYNLADVFIQKTLRELPQFMLLVVNHLSLFFPFKKDHTELVFTSFFFFFFFA